MNPLSKLFSKIPSAPDIEQRLKELDLDRRKKQRDVAMLELKKQERVKRAVEAKKAGGESLIRDLFREISQIEIDIGNSNEDLRRLSLSKIALTSFQRKMQLLEQKRDHKGLQKLIERFRDSSLQGAIDRASVDDDKFNRMLHDILGEEEDEAAGLRKHAEDPHYAEFEKTIAAMADAEDVTPIRPLSGGLHVLDNSELQQELAMIVGKIADLQSRIDDLFRRIETSQREASAMHRAAQDLMANPDTYQQGLEMEARASAMDNVEEFTREINSLTEMIKQLEDQKQAIIRNLS